LACLLVVATLAVGTFFASERSAMTTPIFPPQSAPSRVSNYAVAPEPPAANFPPAKTLKWSQLGVNGVRLGMTPAQVRKAKGPPQSVVQFAPGSSWNYPDVLVEFTNGAVTDVACDQQPCVTVDSVRSGATRSEVAAIYGAGDGFQGYAWIYESERRIAVSESPFGRRRAHGQSTRLVRVKVSFGTTADTAAVDFTLGVRRKTLHGNICPRSSAG
jgi:hypothetical protein